MKKLDLFWWSPMRYPRLAYTELTSGAAMWLRLAMETRRPFLNFGDELNPLVVREVTGREIRWVPPRRAELIAIGSIIELFTFHGAGAMVWGTGLRQEPSSQETAEISSSLGRIVAVRGPKTRDGLGADAGTPLGDPGVFAPRLVSAKRTKGERRVVVLPHFRTHGVAGGRDVLNECRRRGWQVVPATTEPIAVIEAIRDASLVLTSSLHGLIVAHAMGSPVVLVDFFEGDSGELDFKYEDYLASVGVSEAWVSMTAILAMPSLHPLIEAREGEVADVMLACSELARGLEASLAGVQ